MNIGLMARVPRRKRMSLTGIVLSLVVSTMLLLLLVFLLLEPLSGDYEVAHSYFVDIDATDDEKFNLICPIPTTASGELRKSFSRDVRVMHGSATITTVTSQYGPALSISGRGDVNISWTDRWSGSWPSELSDLTMSHWQGGELTLNCWIYCDNDGITIHLKSTSSGHLISEGLTRGHSTTRTIDGVLAPDGWQLMNVVTRNFTLI